MSWDDEDFGGSGEVRPQRWRCCPPRAEDDCSAVTVQYEALFDARGFSIPAAPDGDADGDGRNESFRVYGTLNAARLPDP